MTAPSISSYRHPVTQRITIKGARDDFEMLGPASDHVGGDVFTPYQAYFDRGFIDRALLRDKFPLPSTADREGYHGPRHLDWWVSGLLDAWKVVDSARRFSGESPGRVLELGCASGRVLRHFPLQYGAQEAWGCDLNVRHTEWIRRLLPGVARTFQNHTLASLPLEDNYFDAVCAFSVFSHIDDFELAWIAELRRILRPGGVLYLTTHTDHTWDSMDANWPIHQGLSGLFSDFGTFEELQNRKLPAERVVFWWPHTDAYNANVFHSNEYLRSAWGSIIPVKQIIPRGHDYQDVVVMQK